MPTLQQILLMPNDDSSDSVQLGSVETTRLLQSDRIKPELAHSFFLPHMNVRRLATIT